MQKYVHQSHQARSPHHHIAQKKNRLWLTLLKWASIIGLCLFIILTFWVMSVAQELPDPQNLSTRQIGQTTKIYDRTGKILLYEIFNERKRTLVKLTDIPDFAKQATLAIEDKNFYNHNGIAYKSILRAAISNILGSKSGQGGASTLTQQLIKNAIVGDDHSLVRKIKEAILATQLEKKYTKDEILEFYLNEIPYGSTNYGIEAAAQSYFGKKVSEITLAQAATLAALPQAPSRYLNNFPKLKERRDYVLDVMVTQNYISKTEADLAKQDEIDIKYHLDNNIKAPHFVMMVKAQLAETLGERMVETGGLSVITSLDYAWQEIAEEEVKKGAEYNKTNRDAQNAALVAIDVKTGEIRAMVGSRDFFDKEYDGQFNVALAPRQPGSSFKPITYVAGFTRGYTPNTILYDVETSFPNSGDKPYEPKNYDLKEHGPVSLRTALQGSLNIPAVKMMYLAGVENVLDLAEKMGYTTLSDHSRFGLSLVLGGGEVTLLEHTNAFAAFAREGKYLPSVAILKVSDNNNVALYEYEKPDAIETIDRNSALWLTDVLADNAARAYIFGANSYLQLGDRPVAAKTGTTNDYRDGWLMGYTPSLAVGVWTGNNDNSPMKKGAGGSTSSGPMWKEFMLRVHKGTPIEYFPEPEHVAELKPVLAGQDSGLQEVEIDTISGKLATEFTPEETKQKKKFFAGHSILFHIDKNDPKGPSPTNPDADPQFRAWENGIIAWAGKENPAVGKIPLEISSPPTEYDDLHKPELTPTLSILNPQPNSSVPRTIFAEITATAPQGVARARYFIDNIFVGESTEQPNFGMMLDISQFTAGFHTFEARAYDSNFNTGKSSLTINITGEAAHPTATWSYPPANTTISSIDFPLAITFNPTQPSRIQKIILFMRHKNDADKTIIATFTENFNQPMIYKLEKRPEKDGQYEFSLQIDYDNGYSSESQILPVFIAK